MVNAHKDKNKVALITGGSRGIGLGIAKALAADGINLAIKGVRKENEVSGTLDKLKTFGMDVLYCQGNIASSQDRDKIINKIKERFNRLDILVNNAGVAPKERKDILQASEEGFENLMKINLHGPYFLSQSVANWMIEQKEQNEDLEACIITISSISSTIASVNRGEYCLSKAGLSMMTKLFAARLGEYNIPVYEIQPGIIETDMTAGVKEKYDKLIAEGLMIQRRWGRPEDVGKAVLALVSGSMAYSTGQVIMVDGGLSLPRL